MVLSTLILVSESSQVIRLRVFTFSTFSKSSKRDNVFFCFLHIHFVEYCKSAVIP